MRLLTFGDSWSYGVGAGYQESWTQEYYHNHQSDNELANKVVQMTHNFAGSLQTIMDKEELEI